MTLQKRIATAVATGALLLNSFTTSAFATTIELSGNGNNSTNNASVNLVQNTTVVQSNSANVNNTVNADADTGNNDANGNTGGDVLVHTGNATVNATVNNTLNSNIASVDCCPNSDTDVLISGNGQSSNNTVDLGSFSSTGVWQSNEADVNNTVNADAKTGKNDADGNTGGDVIVITGNASTDVNVSNSGNTNSARIGGGQDGDSTGSVSLRIVGNGQYSDNDILLGLFNLTTISQNNEADINNDVDANSKTGKNDANGNTGGDVLVHTGDAATMVDVDNMVNFNFADADCGCLLEDLTAKIHENGQHTENDIAATVTQDLAVYQDNCGDEWEWDEWWWWWEDDCGIDNDVDADSKTGKNDADGNTGDVEGGDPSVITGDAETNVEVDNSGNVNVYGSTPDFDFPIPDFGLNLEISLDLEDLLDLING